MMHVCFVENEQMTRSNQQLEKCYVLQERVATMQCVVHITAMYAAYLTDKTLISQP